MDKLPSIIYTFGTCSFNSKSSISVLLVLAHARNGKLGAAFFSCINSSFHEQIHYSAQNGTRIRGPRVCPAVTWETKRHLGPARAFFARESLVLHKHTTLEPTSGPTGVGRIDLGARESHRKRRRDIDSGAQVLRERTDFWKSTMGAKTDHHSQFT